ncbi:hypothetical protein ABGB17_17635 [Sphaerisporangium sp. B11E5]|uniref:hypothetical protein n=1 Tax=Sphaerisporangium sp. B11E5 TaxID=3153563 RepID=UPI00325C3D02
MPTREHQIWLELIRERPSLAADLLGCVCPDVVPAYHQARVESGELADHKPTEYRADTVVSLLAGQTPILSVIVEVQRREDMTKPWSWPAYLATLRARMRCPVVLLVITPNAPVAGWCRRPISLGHPGSVLRPLVLGPDEIPLITDPRQAETNPELSVLSALTHADSPHGEKVLAAMLDAFEHIDPDQAGSYIDEVLAMLPAAARHVLEAMMSTGTREWKSDFARRLYGQGEAEGEAKGEAKMLLAVLSARGFAVCDETRARVFACTDLDQLEAWGRRAANAVTIEEVFD